MKKVWSLLMACFLVLLLAAPALAAFDLQGAIETLLDDVFNGLLHIVGIIILGFATVYAHRLTKKFKLEYLNDVIDGYFERGIMYGEEKGRKAIKDTGIALTGAQKFDSAYNYVDENLKKIGIGYLGEEETKKRLVAKLTDLRAKGQINLEEYVKGKIPQE